MKTNPEISYSFSENFTSGDLTKWGASDFYDDKADELRLALASKLPFDTGWGSCKKEICSSQVSFDGKLFTCQVSVSDDFDTGGVGTSEFDTTGDAEKDFDAICKHLDIAAEEAENDRQGNATYRGFTLMHGGQWTETYIQNTGEWNGDSPPGDNYHQWGFQGETENMDEETKEKIEDWIDSYPGDEETLEINGWTVSPWKSGH